MMSKVEDLIENLNGFGKYQKVRYVLICLSGLLPPIASYIHSFIAASPKYSCSTNNLNFSSLPAEVSGLNYYYSRIYYEKCLNVNGPYRDDSTSSTIRHGVNCSSRSSSISSNSDQSGTIDVLLLTNSTDQPSGSLKSDGRLDASLRLISDMASTLSSEASALFPVSNCTPLISASITRTVDKCNSWTFDKTYYQNTLTEEWGLVCDQAIWRSNMQAIYYAGILVGAIIQGYASKRFGQKPTLIFSLLITLIGCLTLSFAPHQVFGNLISYIWLVSSRFLIAIGSHGISISGYMLSMETISRSKKKYCSLIFEFFFSIGQLVLVLAAYFLRDWRQLTLIIILPCLPFLLFICVCNESLHYLIANKKYGEVEKVLEKIAKSNNTQFDRSLWNSFVVKEVEKPDRRLSDAALKPNLFFFVIIILNWIINNFVFHGLGLRSNDLGVNPYATFAFSAVVELVCSVFTFKLVQSNARRKPYFVFIFISGVCCTTIYFSRNLILTILAAMVAKFCVSSSYAIIRLYSSELFPEPDRKNNLTRCSIMARLGSVVAPFIIGVGDYHFKELPFLIFGVSCFVSALLSLALPQIESEKFNPDTKLEKPQQHLQNNWLDGQDLYFDKEADNALPIDEIEMKSIF